MQGAEPREKKGLSLDHPIFFMLPNGPNALELFFFFEAPSGTRLSPELSTSRVPRMWLAHCVRLVRKIRSALIGHGVNRSTTTAMAEAQAAAPKLLLAKGTPLDGGALAGRFSVLSYNLLAPIYVRPIGACQVARPPNRCAPGRWLCQVCTLCASSWWRVYVCV